MANLACPEHNDVVLYRETSNPFAIHMIQITNTEEPVECSKCKIHYFKHECKEVE